MSNDSVSENDPALEGLDTYESTADLEINGNVSQVKCTAEQKQPREKYPKYVFLIVLAQFCERFSNFGIRTVLFIFLTSKADKNRILCISTKLLN